MFRNLSIGSLLTGLYLFSVPVFSFSESLGLSFIPQVVGAMTVVYAAFIILSKMSFYNNYAVYLYISFCIWAVFSSFFAPHHVNSEAIQSLLKIAVITAGISFILTRPGELNVILIIYFVSIFLTVYMNYDDIMALRAAGELEEDMRFDGTFENANTAAIYALSVIWSGSFVLVTSRQNLLIKVLLVAGIILASLVIIYSGSRKGILGIFILSMGFSYLFYKHFGHSVASRMIIGIGVTAGLVLLGYVLVTSPFFSRLTAMFSGEETSFSIREYLIKEALRVWSDSPRNFMMGVGYGNFHFYNYLRLYSHTTFTETLVTTGIVGFGIFFSSLGSICMLFYNLLKQRSGRDKLAIQAVMLFLVLILFFSAFSVMISDRVFWPMIGMLYTYGMLLKNGPIQDSHEMNVAG